MPLALNPNRRLTNDERQSPAIAQTPTTAPSRQESPMRFAASGVTMIAAATPRHVLELPSKR